MQAVTEKRALTIPEFKAETGWKETTVRKLIREERLPTIRAGRRIYITRETVERLLRGELDTGAARSR